MCCKALETLIETVCIPLCANVHPHLTYPTFYFFSVSCNLKVLMLECHHFSPTTGSLCYDG